MILGQCCRLSCLKTSLRLKLLHLPRDSTNPRLEEERWKPLRSHPVLVAGRMVLPAAAEHAAAAVAGVVPPGVVNTPVGQSFSLATNSAKVRMLKLGRVLLYCLRARGSDDWQCFGRNGGQHFLLDMHRCVLPMRITVRTSSSYIPNK